MRTIKKEKFKGVVNLLDLHLTERDEICVEVVETDNPLPDKLKQFRLLEAALKKEGLI